MRTKTYCRFFPRAGGAPGVTPRRALTLIEVLVALTVIGVMLAISAPSVVRTMEQAHADVAGGTLRAVWTAQRFYWLDHRVYASQLTELENAGLLDSVLVNGSGRYRYAIQSAGASSFVAAATRVGSGVWSGQFLIDETGTVTGTVRRNGGGASISPGFE